MGSGISLLLADNLSRLYNPLSLVLFLVAVGLTAAAAVGKIRYL